MSKLIAAYIICKLRYIILIVAFFYIVFAHEPQKGYDVPHIIFSSVVLVCYFLYRFFNKSKKKGISHS